MSVALPKISSKHLRVLEVQNETDYNTRAIRTLLTRCLRALNLRVRGVVRVIYSAVGEHWGRAAVGHAERKTDGGYIINKGVNMSLTVPRDPTAFSRDQFARVIHHEALHWKGVLHNDMTEEQLHCSGPAPAWCVDVDVAFQAPKSEAERMRSEANKREKKLVHARVMLTRAERKLKLATTIVERWRRRVLAAERAVSRAAALKIAAEKTIADVEGRSELAGRALIKEAAA